MCKNAILCVKNCNCLLCSSGGSVKLVSSETGIASSRGLVKFSKSSSSSGVGMSPFIKEIHTPYIFTLLFATFSHVFRESVDSLCRDDADMPMPSYIGKACNRPNATFVSLFR